MVQSSTGRPCGLRVPLSRHLKAYVWAFTHGLCWYCGYELNPFDDLVFDHVMPVSAGGGSEIENLVPACSTCNDAKGALLLEEWRRARPWSDDDPDEYPWLREDLPDGRRVLTGVFWFERSENAWVHSERRYLVSSWRRRERERRR